MRLFPQITNKAQKALRGLRMQECKDYDKVKLGIREMKPTKCGKIDLVICNIHSFQKAALIHLKNCQMQCWLNKSVMAYLNLQKSMFEISRRKRQTSAQ